MNEELEKLEQTLQVIKHTHRFDIIIDTSRKILAINPRHEEANFFLIQALYNSHAFEPMHIAIKLALHYWSDKAWTYYFLYLYYLYKGGKDYILAKENIETAIKMAPQTALYYRSLGEIYLINREPEKAAVHLAKAVELNPSNPEYRSRLALALLRSGNLNECFQTADKALKDGADEASVYDSVGMIYTLSGNLEKGEELFRVALRIVPTYDYFQKHLDWVIREKDDKNFRESQGKKYTPLYLRQTDRKRFF